VNRTPDAIVRVRFSPERSVIPRLLSRTEHVQAAILVRQLRGELIDQPETTLSTGGVGRKRQRRPRAEVGCRRPVQVCQQFRLGHRSLHHRSRYARWTGCGLRPVAESAPCPGRVLWLSRLRAALAAHLHLRGDLRHRETSTTSTSSRTTRCIERSAPRSTSRGPRSLNWIW
jgi:hypothetical protein